MSDTGKTTLYHWIMSIAGTMAVFWATFGFIIQPTVEAVAQETFKKMLIAQGVDPKVFKDLTRKTENLTKSVADLHADLETVKQDVDKVVEQTQGLEKTSQSTNCLAQKLLNLQLGLPASPTLC